MGKGLHKVTTTFSEETGRCAYHLPKPVPGGNLLHKHKLENLTWWEIEPYNVNSNQMNRLKRVEKFHPLRSQLMFSEAPQTEWREPFDFPIRIFASPM